MGAGDDGGTGKEDPSRNAHFVQDTGRTVQAVLLDNVAEYAAIAYAPDAVTVTDARCGGFAAA